MPEIDRALLALEASGVASFGDAALLGILCGFAAVVVLSFLQ